MRHPYPTYGMASMSFLHKAIEEVMDKWPDYMIWCIECFQDVTVAQAKHFKERYGMELPAEVIAPAEVEPFVFTKENTSEDYIDLCKRYIETYWPEEL